jgi:signal transduction histidine kinase
VALHQALTNLLTNAVKFVPSGVRPAVRLWSEDRGTRLRVWVEDNGIGIDPAYHQRIFGVFERLHAQDAYPGTGIGLAMVKRAMERIGGAVGVESVSGRGSRFWIEAARSR